MNNNNDETNVLCWCDNAEMCEHRLPEGMLKDFKEKLIATIGSEGTEGMTLSRLAEMYQKDWHESIYKYVNHLKQSSLVRLLKRLGDKVKIQKGRDNQLRVIPVNASNQQRVLDLIDQTNQANRSNHRNRRMRNNIYTNGHFSQFPPLRHAFRQFPQPASRIQRTPLIVLTNSRRMTPLNQLSIVPTDLTYLPTNIPESWNEADREWSDIASNSVDERGDTDEAEVQAQETTLTEILFSPTPNLPFTVTASVLPSRNEAVAPPAQNEAEQVAPQAIAIDCPPFARSRTLQRRTIGEINACIARIVQSEEFDPNMFNAAYFVEQLDSILTFV